MVMETAKRIKPACPVCGSPLYKTTYNRWQCSKGHGFQEDSKHETCKYYPNEIQCSKQTCDGCQIQKLVEQFGNDTI